MSRFSLARKPVGIQRHLFLNIIYLNNFWCFAKTVKQFTRLSFRRFSFVHVYTTANMQLHENWLFTMRGCWKQRKVFRHNLHYVLCYIIYRCPRRNGQNFGRVFLMLHYTDITQNTYIQSWTVTEIMAIEKCGLLGCPRTARRPWRHTHHCACPATRHR